MYYISIYSQLFNFIPRYRFEKSSKSQAESSDFIRQNRFCFGKFENLLSAGYIYHETKQLFIQGKIL